MILTALNSYYKRLSRDSKVLQKGFTKEKISYAIVLSKDGKVVDVQDIRYTNGKKPRPKLLAVPESSKRPGNILPFLFWDNTGYVLGVAGDEKKKRRARDLHAAFKQKMLEVIGDTEDIGLVALCKFLQSWQPDRFHLPPFNGDKEILDSNIVFRLDGDRKYLHDRYAARSLCITRKESNANTGTCLVTGVETTLARLHPPIKGVKNAQSSGANIVSFNKNSFISFNKEQSYNAPVSEKVADQYTKALNYLLRRENNRSLSIGDATTVFWALSKNDIAADQAENFLEAILNPSSTDEQETSELGRFLDTVAKGRPLQDFKPDLDPTTQIYVLGLSPNASRLSIRFWHTGTLDFFTKKIAQHYHDLRLEPLPWKTPPSIWRLLIETAPSRSGKHDSKDVPPHLAGEVMRSILTGGNYPHSLLTNIVLRLRTDGDISDLRVALCKAVIMRRMRINYNKEESIVSLDEENKNVGYQLGRLFAELENAQDSAIEGANTTISDQYYGSASSSPATTFPTLFRKYRHHTSKLRKEESKKGAHIAIEKKVGEIINKLPAEFPKTLDIEDQGRFAIGYYHQRSLRFQKKTNN